MKRKNRTRKIHEGYSEGANDIITGIEEIINTQNSDR